MRTIPRRGRVVANGAQASIGRVLARGLWSGREDFDVPGGWHLRDVIEAGDASEFEVWRADEMLGRCRLGMAGAHNRSNALAAVAAAAHAGVAPAAAIGALAGFEGVRRRLEPRGTVRGVTVVDDFAHHPTAIAATLDAVRARLAPGARILAVIEPRSNTMKLGAMSAQLPGSLAAADRVFCYAGGVDWDVAAALAPLGEVAAVDTDLAALVARVAAAARAGDQVVVMSNGGFGGIHDKLLAALAAHDGPQAAC